MPGPDDPQDRRPVDDVWAPPDATPVPAGPPWQQPAAQPSAGPSPWGPPQPGPQQWGPQQPGAQPWQPQQWSQPAWGQPSWGPQQPWGAGPPEDPAARRRKRRLAYGSLAGVVVLLVAVLGGAVWWQGQRDDRIRAEVAALLPELQAFVERERGLPFLEPVDVEVLDDDAFLEALYETPEDAPEPSDLDPEPTLKALGLLDPDADLEGQVEDSLDAGVVGFYDPATDRLVVRGTSVNAVTRLVIVHEITHALQDQHFDIDRPDLDEADDERSLAFSSLVEGDATRVDTAWYLEQPPDVQREIEELFGAGAGGEGGVVEDLLGFPYYAGPVYAEVLLDEGGQEALDAAFETPPTTTDEILNPGLAGEVVSVPEPELPGELVDEGVLGALGLDLLLGTDPLEPEQPADSWAGDRYVTTEEGDRTCTLAHVAFEGGPDARAGAVAALQDWAADQPEAEVGDGPAGTVLLRSCVEGL